MNKLIKCKIMARLLYIVSSLYVTLCPYTKVEESFNIQAFHDILYHRHNLAQYDHNEFPGVVPRTFVGPLLISILSSPIIGTVHLAGASKFWGQYVVRLTLAFLVIAAWKRLRDALQKQFGSTFSWWYTLVTVTQYHFVFYMSRPLPNIMALPLVLLAFEGWILGKHKQFLISAGASIIIFRSELAMLFGLFLIIDLYFKKISLTQLMKIVIPASVGLVTLTVVVDSVFWGRLLWPELEVFWYNTVLNKSSDWGTSPFLWYFYSALPRGLGPSLTLIPIGAYLDRRVLQYVAPALVYILLYSVLPHKELRFIIYVFPLLNIASAAACSYVFIRKTKTPLMELMFWGSVFVVVGNIMLTAAFVMVAMTNYPGGVAINRFNKLAKVEPFVNVHICNLAAQTGVTRFTEVNDHWLYRKNESLTPEQLQEFTHILVEAKSKYSPTVKTFANTHIVLDSIETFSQVAMNYKMLPPIKIKTKPAIFILQRTDFRDFPYGHAKPIISIDDDEEEKTQTTDYNGYLDIVEHNYVNEELTSSELVEISPFEGDNSEIVKDNDIVYQAEEETDDVYDKPKQASNEVKHNDIVYQVDQEDENDIYAEPRQKKKEFKRNQRKIKKKSTDLKSSRFDKDDVIEEPIPETEPDPDLPKAKKIFDELKTLREERKKKAIAKIKSETRKEVVASAKEKLKEILKRHQHIAEELSETFISNGEEEDGRGDIPENQYEELQDAENEEDLNNLESAIENNIKNMETINRTNENINAIVEEVIVRLIDRKIYDHKTKPEDIKAEDRQIIQQIVEEVLAENTNYSNSQKE